MKEKLAKLPLCTSAIGQQHSQKLANWNPWGIQFLLQRRLPKERGKGGQDQSKVNVQ